MFLKVAGLILKVFMLSFVMWITLTTAIPQVLVKYDQKNGQPDFFIDHNSITYPAPLGINNSNVYFVIGHPDDEVMFFSPALVELNKSQYNNKVKIICFSAGDAVHEDMGRIRSRELYQSAQIMGVNSADVTILDNFKDGMHEKWDAGEIARQLQKLIDYKLKDPSIIVTFDEFGVSGHPNHISLYHGVSLFTRTILASKHSKTSVYTLKTLNFLEKYSFHLLTNIELFVYHLSELIINRLLNIKVNISFFNSELANESIKIYSDLNMLSVSYAAMAYGHYSQMVWFRYGWLTLSRYLTYNHLVKIH